MEDKLAAQLSKRSESWMWRLAVYGSSYWFIQIMLLLSKKVVNTAFANMLFELQPSFFILNNKTTLVYFSINFVSTLRTIVNWAHVAPTCIYFFPMLAEVNEYEVNFLILIFFLSMRYSRDLKWVDFCLFVFETIKEKLHWHGDNFQPSQPQVTWVDTIFRLTYLRFLQLP